MSSAAKRLAAGVLTLAVVVAIGRLIRASVQQVPSNTWAATSDMAQVRGGASAALLADGKVLVTGGIDDSGAVTATVERYSADGGSFLATPPMSTARANHSTTLLADGRVLVAGGAGADGHALAAAEIYDPASNAWTPAGPMNVARRGHTATLLSDGTVLIAGGDDTGTANASLELFDPASASFTLLSASLASARTLHAAAALADGRVMIAGGFDGTNPLATVDVFDPKTGAVSAGPAMSSPRSDLSLTTLLGGKVLAAGGAGPGGELSTAEVYDSTSNAWVATDNTLASARQNHLAFLLPHNNEVLIVGGIAGGIAVPGAEIYTPWEGTNGAFCATAVCASGYAGPGLPTAARAWAAGSALSYPAGDTVRSGPNDGLLLLAGGSGLKSAELYGFATIKTDKSDYAPGTTVTITGSGFVPGESVALVLREEPNLDTHPLLNVTADANGNIVSTEFQPDEHDVNVRFYLSAFGQQSQAETAFTDGNLTAATLGVRKSDCATTSAAFAAADTVCVHSQVSVGGGGTSPDFFVRWVRPNNTVAFTDTHPGVTDQQLFDDSHSVSVVGTWTVQACKNTGCNGGNLLTSTTFTVAAGTTLAVSPASGDYGGSAALAATLTSAGSGVSGKTINFTLNGTSVGSATTDSSGLASLASVSLAGIDAGDYPSGVGATFDGDTDFAGSSKVASLTVNKALLTATIVGDPTKPYDGSTTATLASANFLVDGLLTGESIAVTKTSGTYNSADVGTATTVSTTLADGDFAPAVGTKLTNYVLPTSASGPGHITAVTLTASIIGDPTKPYDGNTTATLTPANFSVAGLVGSEAITINKTNGTYNSADVAAANTVSTTLAAGDFTAGPGTTLSNYVLPTTANGPGHITAVILTASIIGNPTKPYDGNTAATLTPANFAIGGLVSGQSVTVNKASGTYNSADVATANTVSTALASGDFTAGAGTTLSNYMLPTLASGPGHITAVPLTVTADAIPNTAAVDHFVKTYDGHPFSPFTVRYDGFVNGEGSNVLGGTLTFSGAGTTTAGAGGPYPVTPAGLTSTNYVITFVDGGVDINKAALTITADNKEKTYDGQPFTGFTATITGFVNGETVAVVSGVPGFTGPAVGAVNPGEWAITPTAGSLSAANYEFTAPPSAYVDGKLTIGYGTCNAGVGPGNVILPPINTDGSSVYKRKGGSTIPVKFRVCNAAGLPISDPAAVFGTGGSITIINAVRGTVDNVIADGTADIPDVAFRFDGSQWIFNMATTNLTAGQTYGFRINLKLGNIPFQVGVK